MNFLLFNYLTAIWQILSGYRTKEEHYLNLERKVDVSLYLDWSKSLKMLDFANGRLRPQYLILNTEGHKAFGVALANHSRSSLIDYCFRFVRWIYQRHIHSKNKRT